MRRSFSATLALAAAFVFATPAMAQQASFSQSDQGDEDRTTIMRFLERAEMGGVASSVGVDAQELGRRTQVMSDADAARVAQQVRDAEQAMAADTITITTTAIIIGLLVLIALILIL